MIRKAKAIWRGTGRAGNGNLSTDSGVLAETPYSFKTRFENEQGHQSRRADRRRACGMFHHGAGFSIAERRLHANGACHRGCRQPRSGRPGFSHQPLGADVARQRAQSGRKPRSAAGRSCGKELPGVQVLKPRSPWTPNWRERFTHTRNRAPRSRQARLAECCGARNGRALRRFASPADRRRGGARAR